MQSFVLPRLMRRDSVIQRIANVLLALDPSKAWRLEIHEHKETRSTQQNRYLWGVCYAALMKVLPGWDAEDIHEYMCGEHFGWETLEGLGKKRLRPLRRSSRLNKQEFADFIDFIQRRAAEHGVFIPDADPEWWLHEDAA